MCRHLLTLAAAFVAVVSLTLGSAAAEARHCGGYHRSRCGGHQRRCATHDRGDCRWGANYGSAGSCAGPMYCAAPQPTCCGAQSAGATMAPVYGPPMPAVDAPPPAPAAVAPAPGI